MSERRKIGLLGVPLDLGSGRRGTDMGPSAVRLAGLTQRLEKLGMLVRDYGYIAVAAPEMRRPGDKRLRFGREIFRTCFRLRDRVRSILDSGATPIVLGGDHSVAMGSVAGVAAHAEQKLGGPLGLLWIDAHADMNTVATTPSGNVHGMPLAVILGEGVPLLVGLGHRTPMVPVEHAVLVGARDLDAGERKSIRALGLTVYTMKDLDERGVSVCMREALEKVTKGTAGFHLSFDMDALDPEEAPGVATPVQGGLTYRESHLACELVAESGRLISMDLVEVNPILDERNRTALLAVELILSAMGKRIF
ncbi:MAG: arginase [Planctomycetota bacterium]